VKRAKKQTVSEETAVEVTTAEQVTAPCAPVSPVKLEEVLLRVQGRIIRAMDAIIDKLIKKAKDGSYADAKFLFQFAGIKEISTAVGEEASVDGAAVADRFLKEILGERKEKAATCGGKNESVTKAIQH
jgi:hypothetical protein